MVEKLSGKRLRILLVEDLRANAWIFKTLLSGEGHEVVTAADGVSAWDMARQFRPDAIVSDLGLPGAMDGCDLARAVRGDGTFCALHLIAMTGYDDDERRGLAREAGFDDYLVKPVTIAQLLSVLDRNG